MLYAYDLVHWVTNQTRCWSPSSVRSLLLIPAMVAEVSPDQLVLKVSQIGYSHPKGQMPTYLSLCSPQCFPYKRSGKRFPQFPAEGSDENLKSTHSKGRGDKNQTQAFALNSVLLVRQTQADQSIFCAFGLIYSPSNAAQPNSTYVR